MNELFGGNLRRLRQKKGHTQWALAQALGLATSTISMYEQGRREPSFQILKLLGAHFSVPLTALLGEESGVKERAPIPNHPDILPITFRSIPLLGNIACGPPMEAIEERGEYVQVDGRIKADFAIRAVGDSMEGAHIFHGDLVYVLQQEVVENGQIAVVLINNQVTLKRFRQVDNVIILSPENPKYQDMVFQLHERSDIRILGRVVAFVTTPH